MGGWFLLMAFLGGGGEPMARGVLFTCVDEQPVFNAEGIFPVFNTTDLVPVFGDIT